RAAREATRDDSHAALPDAPAGDTHVLGFDEAGGPGGPKDAGEDLHDAVRQALLDLQAARQNVHDARDLGEPGEAPARKIGHVGAALEGQEVMDADGVELDVAE